MLAIAAFGGDDVQIMQLGFANGATEYFKGPNIIEILEHDFDNSLAFRACRFTAKKAMVRLSDIAKETGYSLSTVSKALNGRADVSEETRQTINAVLKGNNRSL